MEQHTNNELEIMLKNLQISVDKGFSDVICRQDKTNGNVIKNTEFRLSATGAILVIKWLIGLVGLGTIANLILTLQKVL
jgi:hypothetical protein